MNPNKDNYESEKMKIASKIAELSRLLGMIPSDDTVQMHGPLTQNQMALSDWLDATRNEFLKLSLLISRNLNIQLQ
jgi:hypothetical protein